MSYDPLHAIEETAGAAISTRFAVVQLSSGDVIVTTGPTDRSFGVAQDTAASGDKVDVVLEGRTKVKASGAVTKGDILQAEASGEVATDDGATASRYLIGTALEDAADGDVFWMYFNPDKSSQ